MRRELILSTDMWPEISIVRNADGSLSVQVEDDETIHSGKIEPDVALQLIGLLVSNV